MPPVHRLPLKCLSKNGRLALWLDLFIFQLQFAETQEFNEHNDRRTHLFYCDPQRSDQKGGCEVTHEMIRRVLPKGTSFDDLDQEDISMMMSHINSYNRKKLNNQSAHQLFSFLNSGEILEKLNIKLIPANEINLTPLLLKK